MKVRLSSFLITLFEKTKIFKNFKKYDYSYTNKNILIRLYFKDTLTFLKIRINENKAFENGSQSLSLFYF
jgi:hypothetical protein